MERPKETQYTVARFASGWIGTDDGRVVGFFDTQRAAFDEIIRTAADKLLEGGDLLIIVEGKDV